MAEGRERQPVLTPAGRRAAADRQERLAQALRENLRKRKAQQRSRLAEPGPAADVQDKVGDQE